MRRGAPSGATSSPADLRDGTRRLFRELLEESIEEDVCLPMIGCIPSGPLRSIPIRSSPRMAYVESPWPNWVSTTGSTSPSTNRNQEIRGARSPSPNHGHHALLQWSERRIGGPQKQMTRGSGIYGSLIRRVPSENPKWCRPFALPDASKRASRDSRPDVGRPSFIVGTGVQTEDPLDRRRDGIERVGNRRLQGSFRRQERISSATRFPMGNAVGRHPVTNLAI
jgi:hypothetical protein